MIKTYTVVNSMQHIFDILYPGTKLQIDSESYVPGGRNPNNLYNKSFSATGKFVGNIRNEYYNFLLDNNYIIEYKK